SPNGMGVCFCPVLSIRLLQSVAASIILHQSPSHPGRYTMRCTSAVTFSVAVALTLAGASRSGDQQETPIGPPWWPSEWGAADQRGAANRLTPQKVLEATRLVKDGKVYQLGHVYEHGMPLFGKRHFSLTIPGSPTGGPDGANRPAY